MLLPRVRLAVPRVIGLRPTALVAVGLLAMSWLGCYGVPKNPMTLRQVQAKVNKALPLGASREQVELWLKSQGIDYRYLPSATESMQVYSEYIATGELTPDDLGGCVKGYIQDTEREFVVTWDISIWFVLDKNSRTIRHLVTKMGDGL